MKLTEHVVGNVPTFKVIAHGVVPPNGTTFRTLLGLKGLNTMTTPWIHTHLTVTDFQTTH